MQQQIKYLVCITFPNKAFITYYFSQKFGEGGAYTFFNNYCYMMGIRPVKFREENVFHREKRATITIDFDTIKDLSIQSIFDLS